jgi:hypothetical protein
MTTFDNYARARFNDGEGVVFTDFEDSQDLALARVFDQLVEGRAPALAAGNDLSGSPATLLDPEVWGEMGDRAIGQVIGGSVAFTLAPGHAMVYPTPGSFTKLTVGPGTLFQKVSPRTGAAPTFLAYEVRASDGLDFTIAAGHATLARYDVIQVKLELVDSDAQSRDFEDAVSRQVTTQLVSKRRRVQATFSYKQGTAAASPTHPLPDAGFVSLAAVRVPAAWTSGVDPGSDVSVSGSLAIPMQTSVPLGVHTFTTFPDQFMYAGATNWSLSSGGSALATGAGSNLIVPGPHFNCGRLVGVSIEGSFITSGSVLLGAQRWVSISGQFFSTAVDISGQMLQVAGTHFGFAGMTSGIQGATSPLSSSGFAGDPLWCCGSRVPSERPLKQAGAVTFPVGHASQTGRLALKVAAGSTSVVGPVRWWVAG